MSSSVSLPWIEDGRRAFASSASAAAPAVGSAAPVDAAGRPEHIGIVAADFYVPDTFVSQSSLEEADGVPSGKYTKGLMQVRTNSFTSFRHRLVGT